MPERMRGWGRKQGGNCRSLSHSFSHLLCRTRPSGLTKIS